MLWKLNLLMFLSWAAILYFIVRYRVYITIKYEPRLKDEKRVSPSNPSRSGRSTQSKASNVEPIRTQEWAGMQHVGEIKQALIAQGMKARPAQLVANRVCACSETDFGMLLRKAIQEAAAV
jgi:hypothetical protein